MAKGEDAAGFVITARAHDRTGGAGPVPTASPGQVSGGVVTALLIMIWAKVPLRYGLDRAVARRLLAFGLPLAASLGVRPWSRTPTT